MTGKTALVTGANRGIGREVARQLIERGWQVWITARSEEKAQSAADDLGDAAIGLTLDVNDEGSVTRAFRTVAESGRGLDAAVNNAGIDYDTDQSASAGDLVRIRRAFETNLFGAWAVARAAAPLLGRRDHSILVNVSSEAGSLDSMGKNPPGYSTAKAALNSLTRILAAELRDKGTLVNTVCSGWTATDMGGGGRPIAAGAASVVWAATLGPDGPTGGFFRDGKPLPW